MKQSRLILCRNCIEWKQAPNPEMGTCCYDGGNDPTNYDTRCLLGLYEEVSTPKTKELAATVRPVCPANSQSAAALKDCIQLFASLKLALGVLKTMCRVAGLNGGMQKAVDMDLWIDKMVEHISQHDTVQNGEHSMGEDVYFS